MPRCLKQVVTAVLRTVGGQVHMGRNDIQNTEVSVCPRDEAGYASGEGYHLCKDVCGQSGHAETQAIAKAVKAGDCTAGAVISLYGHTYACADCRSVAEAAGIAEIRVCEFPTEKVK